MSTLSDKGASAPPVPNSPPGKSGRFEGSGDSLDSMAKNVAMRGMKLDDYVRKVIGSDALWNALVESISEEIPAAHGAYWVVLVDNSLMALAGAAAIGRRLGRSILVPMRQFERAPTPETLSIELGHLDPNERLDGWIATAGPLTDAAEDSDCLLVRAWGVVPSRFATDLGDTFGADQRAPGGGLIALVRSADPEEAGLFDCGTVLNLTSRQDKVVARTIHGLRLPSHEPVASVEEAAGLMRRLLLSSDIRTDGVLRALNTAAHHRFEQLAWPLDLEQRPDTRTLFNETVLAEDEDRPRHAAALFLVSHFSRIPADQLIAIGDVLVRQTPATQPGADAARPPSAITDRVLDECSIKIAVTPESGAYAVFAPKGGNASEEPLRLADAICKLFAREAALLKERYLCTLAQAIIIGHPSTEIARTYEDLELLEIRHAAALDATMARERLVRVAFGHPVLTGERDPDRHEINYIVRSMERVILRLPAFIARVAQSIATLPADDVLGALCTAVPATLDEERQGWFCRWAAEIFWRSYARVISGLTLQGYPALFDDSPDGLARRHALVGVLWEALDRSAWASPSSSISAQINVPFLGRLLADVGVQFFRIPTDDGLDIALLIDAAANFLLRALRHQPWRNVSTGAAAADRPLAEAFLHLRTRRWIAMPRDRLADQEPKERENEIRRLYRMCAAILEALVGSASFEEMEDIAIDVWLMHAMGGEQSVENVKAGYFRDSQAWNWALSNRDPDFGEPFYIAIQSLLELMPLFVILAATRSGETPEGTLVFTFSEPFAQWLVEPTATMTDPPIRHIVEMLEKARRLQAAWRDAHDHWHIPVGSPGRVVKAFKERVEALRAFSQTLKPMIDASRRRAPSVRAQGGAAPSSGVSPGATGSEKSA